MSYKFGDLVQTHDGYFGVVLFDDQGDVALGLGNGTQTILPRKKLSQVPANEEQMAANHPANFSLWMKQPPPPIGETQDGKKAKKTKAL